MPKVDIYIKIRFHGNPQGMGVAAAIAECIYKGTPNTKTATSQVTGTENRLALCICSDALDLLKKPCRITYHIDNSYVRYTAANGWVEKWEENGWKKPNGDVPANIKEWQQLLMMCKGHLITWQPYDTKYDMLLDKILNGMENANEMQKGVQICL